jgi:hypothetical protein
MLGRLALRRRPAAQIAVAMLLAIPLPVLQASAFTIDPTSGTNTDGSSRFVDPDEQIHSSFFGGSAVNEDGWADRHSAAPATVGTAQGITFPNWFFSTSPRAAQGFKLG